MGFLFCARPLAAGPPPLRQAPANRPCKPQIIKRPPHLGVTQLIFIFASQLKFRIFGVFENLPLDSKRLMSALRGERTKVRLAIGNSERCLSGRKGRFAKPLYELKLVSRVRIPPSPQDRNDVPAFGGAFLFAADGRARSIRMRKTKMVVSEANEHRFGLKPPPKRDRRSQSLPLRKTSSLHPQR